MAKSGSMILREAREAAEFSREKLAMRLECVSAATIKRWEYGESRPDSADVARIGELLDDSTLWPRWMCAVDDEYARRHPYLAPSDSTVESMVRLGLEAADVQRMLEPLLRDLIDGAIDDHDFLRAFFRAVQDSETAHRAALETLREGGGPHAD